MADAIPAGPTTATAAGGRPPQTTANARSVVIRVAMLAAILGFVFGILLPRIVDYDDVVAALAHLTAGQLIVLALFSAVAYVAQAADPSAIFRQLAAPTGGSPLSGQDFGTEPFARNAGTLRRHPQSAKRP